MANWIFQIDTIRKNFFVNNANGYENTNAVQYGGFSCTDNPIQADWINNNYKYYSRFSQLWEAFNCKSDAYDTKTSGYTTSLAGNSKHWHKYGATYAGKSAYCWYSRGVWQVSELGNFGYISATCGGLDEFLHDKNMPKETPDYEPVYGHGVATWPMPNTTDTQFRNSASLPVDGTSTITLTGSSYNRSKYLDACYYLLHITNTGAINSGNVKFFIEERQTYNQTRNNAPVYWSHHFYRCDSNPQRWYLTCGYVYSGPSNITKLYWDNALLDSYDTALCPSYTSRYPSLKFTTERDFRFREHAIISVNEEYYAVVYGASIYILSTKCTMTPLWSFHMDSYWTSDTYKRIAGIAVDNLKLYVLSESGSLKLITGGTVNNLTSAPAVVDEKRYGNLVKIGNYLYALVGTCSHNYGNTSTGTVGLVKYNILTDQWTTLSDFSFPARFNGKSFKEMIVNGTNLAILAEDVRSTNQINYDLTSVCTTGSGSGYTWYNKLSSTLISYLDFTGANKIKISFKVTGNCTLYNAFLVSVPKGSPTNNTVDFIDKVPITFSGVSANVSLTTGVNTSDLVALPTIIDTTKDYYIIHALSGANSFYNDASNFRNSLGFVVTYKSGNIAVGTKLDLSTGWTTEASKLIGPCNIIVEKPNTMCINENRLSDSCMFDTKWQLLLYDTVNNVWNTTKITSSVLKHTYENGPNCNGNNWSMTGGGLLTHKNNIIIRAGYRASQVHVFNLSTTWDSTSLTHIGYGSARNIFSGAYAADKWITMIQDTHLDSIVIQNNTDEAPSSPDKPALLGIIDFNFATDVVNIYANNGNYVGVVDSRWSDGVTSINKDTSIQYTVMGIDYYTGASDFQLITHMSRGRINAWSHRYYIDNATGVAVWVNYMTQNRYIIPIYWKWNGTDWALAKNFANASANPITVPSTPGVNVPLVDGLIAQFGVASNSTFQAGEFHTVNVCYGYVKFARKMIYNWTMFAGKTFSNTETKSMNALSKIKWHYIDPAEWTFTASGPENISQDPYDQRGSFRFPKLKTDTTVNDADIITEFTLNDPYLALAFTPMTSNTSDGQVASASSGGSDAYKAFVDENTVWNPNTTSGGQWFQIDLGAGKEKTVTHYRLNSDRDPSFKSFKLQGSNDGSAWTTVDTQTNVPARDKWAYKVATPGSYRYYRFYIDENYGDYYCGVCIQLYTSALKTNTINFSQIRWNGDNTVKASGYEIYVDKGSGYTRIYPIGRAHRGVWLYFDRQENVSKLKIVWKQASNLAADTTKATVPFPFLDDFGTQAEMDAARLGSSVALDNTKERGSFDSECLGIAPETTTILIDGVYDPNLQPSRAINGTFSDFLQNQPRAANTYALHPYWGFLVFEGGCIDKAFTKSGTNVTISYFWGRRA